MRVLRPLIILAGLLLVWQAIVTGFALPRFILPAPWQVAVAWWENLGILLDNARFTLAEILLGLVTGLALGCGTALAMSWFRPARRWLLPVLVTSQAIPVFALAPMLVLWLGFGMASKVAMATLIIYFPITSAFHDGLRRTEPGWLDLSRSMGASRRAILMGIRIPAALPSLASGLRVAVAIAPIGAIVGEWVGASAGLGYVMLHANARTQQPLMFAALFTLALIAVTLWFAVDYGLRRMLPWVIETNPTEDDIN